VIKPRENRGRWEMGGKPNIRDNISEGERLRFGEQEKGGRRRREL
jgi:hypothetical protein